ARGGDDGVLLEREHDVRRACRGEQVGDRVDALRVRRRVPAAVEDAHAYALLLREVGDEAGAVEPGGPDLEVRVARAAQRAAAEERAAEVRTAAAAAPGDPLRRALERSPRAVEHAGVVQQPQ